MDGEDALNALQLKNHDILDDQIETITAIQGHAFVNDRYGDLSLKTQSTQMQLMAKAFFVN